MALQEQRPRLGSSLRERSVGCLFVATLIPFFFYRRLQGDRPTGSMGSFRRTPLHLPHAEAAQDGEGTRACKAQTREGLRPAGTSVQACTTAWAHRTQRGGRKCTPRRPRERARRPWSEPAAAAVYLSCFRVLRPAMEAAITPHRLSLKGARAHERLHWCCWPRVPGLYSAACGARR